eukprot:2308814-Pyramimonas_sp.AAC.1
MLGAVALALVHGASRARRDRRLGCWGPLLTSWSSSVRSRDSPRCRLSLPPARRAEQGLA